MFGLSVFLHVIEKTTSLPSTTRRYLRHSTPWRTLHTTWASK